MTAVVLMVCTSIYPNRMNASIIKSSNVILYHANAIQNDALKIHAIFIVWLVHSISTWCSITKSYNVFVVVCAVINWFFLFTPSVKSMCWDTPLGIYLSQTRVLWPFCLYKNAYNIHFLHQITNTYIMNMGAIYSKWSVKLFEDDCGFIRNTSWVFEQPLPKDFYKISRTG